MIVRNAKITDVESIHSLVNCYAELDKMLFLSHADIYENIQIFTVAEIEGEILGCGALKVIWNDLAEIKSLAVDQNAFGKGIGRAIVEKCLENAKKIGIKKVFALTLEPEFFEKVGFFRVDKGQLPMKVWSDCARCSKQDHCDEIAMLKQI